MTKRIFVQKFLKTQNLICQYTFDSTKSVSTKYQLSTKSVQN